jgi:hypothetical protein
LVRHPNELVRHPNELVRHPNELVRHPNELELVRHPNELELVRHPNELVLVPHPNESVLVPHPNESVLVRHPNELELVRHPNELVLVRHPNELVLVPHPNESVLVRHPNELIALMGLALMGLALMGLALMGLALMGLALMGLALMRVLVRGLGRPLRVLGRPLRVLGRPLRGLGLGVVCHTHPSHCLNVSTFMNWNYLHNEYIKLTCIYRNRNPNIKKVLVNDDDGVHFFFFLCFIFGDAYVHFWRYSPMSSRICVINAWMEMKVRRSVSGRRMLSSCFICSGLWPIRACCVGCDGCSSFLVMWAGLGVQRLISVLSACFHIVWSRPSSLFACRGSGCLSTSSYIARSCARLRVGITSIEMARPWIIGLVEIAWLISRVFFGCLSGR